MALGNKGYDQNGKLLVLKIKTKNAEGQEVPPYFQVSEKVDGSWKETDNTGITSVTGQLNNLEVKQKEFNGDIVRSVSVYLKDGDETYLIDIRYSILGRSIINSLINIEDTSKPVEISLYQNKRGYSASAVRSGDDTVSWKFGLDEQPKPEELRDKKGTLVKRDYSEVDDFFDEKVNEFLESFVAKASPLTEDKPVKETKKEKKAPEAKQEPADATDDADDEALF